MNTGRDYDELVELERQVFGEGHKPGATVELRLWDLLNPAGNYLTEKALELFANYYYDEAWRRGYEYHYATCPHLHRKDEE